MIIGKLRPFGAAPGLPGEPTWLVTVAMCCEVRHIHMSREKRAWLEGMAVWFKIIDIHWPQKWWFCNVSIKTWRIPWVALYAEPEPFPASTHGSGPTKVKKMMFQRGWWSLMSWSTLFFAYDLHAIYVSIYLSIYLSIYIPLYTYLWDFYEYPSIHGWLTHVMTTLSVPCSATVVSRYWLGRRWTRFGRPAQEILLKIVHLVHLEMDHQPVGGWPIPMVNSG